MDSECSAKFVECLSQFLLTFFKSHTVFSCDIEVIGHVCLNIDRQTKVNFVLEECIERVGKENIYTLSRTFEALRPTGHSNKGGINKSVYKHGSIAVEHTLSGHFNHKLEPGNYDSPIETVFSDNQKSRTQQAPSNLLYEYLYDERSKSVQEADSPQESDNTEPLNLQEHFSSQAIIHSHLHSPATDSVLQENLNVEFSSNNSHQNKSSNVQSIKESSSCQDTEEAGASSDDDVILIEEDEVPELYSSQPSPGEKSYDQQKVDTNLKTGRTFYTYEEFKQVISARKDKYGERLYCRGGKTVVIANSKIKEKSEKYRASLKYVRSHYKCRVEGCPVKVYLIAHQERDILEVKTCNLDHNHEYLIPDQDLVGRTVEKKDPVRKEDEGFQDNTVVQPSDEESQPTELSIFNTSRRKRPSNNILNPSDKYILPHTREGFQRAKRRKICRVCNKRFISNIHKKIHMEVHLSRKSFACHVCHLKFCLKKTLDKHMELHSSSRNDSYGASRKLYQCNFCTRQFQYYSNYKAHEKTHSEKINYKCTYCLQQFSNSITQICHETICIKNTSRLANEYKMKDKDDSMESEDIKKKNKQTQKKKKRSHNGNKPYKCKYCPKSFSTSHSAINHERIHTGERPYKCKYCMKTFSTKTYVITHEMLHTGEKPFKCKYCTKSFSQRNNLITHERIHTGERPYKCRYCCKTFAQKTGVDQHERRHTGEQPFKCKHCQKSFAQLSNLKLHLKNHHTVLI